jgi:L-arabinokinase
LAGARLIFYVSGHGFGHATRACAVIAALRARARSALDIRVRSEAPEWIFTERDPELCCTAARVDAGMLQPNGLDLDLPGTLAAHEEFIAAWDAAVAREAGAIAELGASLVVGDIPPLAFAAARRAGVPGIGVANFSWDWILEGYAEAEPRWRPIVARYRQAYGEAQALFRLPFHGDLSAFHPIVDVPLLVNRSARTRRECRRSLGLADGDRRRLVLVSFGGFGSGPVGGALDEDLSGYVFAGFGPRPAGFRGEWIALSRPSPIRHEDLVQACDATLGKPGYGTVAEAIAHSTRLLYLPRTNFREIPVLERGLARYGCARSMPRDEFARGRWRPHLDALFAMPEAREALPAHGAQVIADALLAHLG